MKPWERNTRPTCRSLPGEWWQYKTASRPVAALFFTVVLFIAFAQPFSHYGRILRELVGMKEILLEVDLLPEVNRKNVTIIVDDLSIVEVAANGSSHYVIDFLHYCHTLTSEFDFSLITLNHHKDIYSSMERPTFLLQTEYLADILI